MGLSCGNPTATANLRPGEVVVDLNGDDLMVRSFSAFHPFASLHVYP
jgi:hypothetical protein